MAGKSSTDLNSALPLDARTARIAAGGGLAVSLRGVPPGRDAAADACRAAGAEQDSLDFIMPHAADSRVEASSVIPCLSVQNTPYPNENPT